MSLSGVWGEVVDLQIMVYKWRTRGYRKTSAGLIDKEGYRAEARRERKKRDNLSPANVL
jgi:hypothetical protein